MPPAITAYPVTLGNPSNSITAVDQRDRQALRTVLDRARTRSPRRARGSTPRRGSAASSSTRPGSRRTRRSARRRARRASRADPPQEQEREAHGHRHLDQLRQPGRVPERDGPVRQVHRREEPSSGTEPSGGRRTGTWSTSGGCRRTAGVGARRASGGSRPSCRSTIGFVASKPSGREALPRRAGQHQSEALNERRTRTAASRSRRRR